jgi:hypothetical protein
MELKDRFDSSGGHEGIPRNPFNGDERNFHSEHEA